MRIWMFCCLNKEQVNKIQVTLKSFKVLVQLYERILWVTKINWKWCLTIKSKQFNTVP